MNDFFGLVLSILRLLLALSLFAFLGWSLLLIWRDIHSQTQQIQKRQQPSISLTYQTGSGKLEAERFFNSQIYIGRDPICEFHTPNETVSSRHARLFFEHGQWWIEDLDSRNGTYLNELPVTSAIVLTNGDHIRCGEIVFTLTMDKSQTS